MAYILCNGEDILRQKAEKVTDFDNGLADLVREMRDHVYLHYYCVGLAAPQVGVSKRAVVVKLGNNGDWSTYVMINPEIKERKYFFTFPEKCASLPEVVRFVPRSWMVGVSYQGIDGHHYHIDVKGLNAVILQHEIDHLDGKLITDYRFMIRWRRNIINSEEKPAKLYSDPYFHICNISQQDIFHI